MGWEPSSWMRTKPEQDVCINLDHWSVEIVLLEHLSCILVKLPILLTAATKEHVLLQQRLVEP